MEEDGILGKQFHIQTITKNETAAIVNYQDTYPLKINELTINDPKEKILNELEKLNHTELERCLELFKTTQQDVKNFPNSSDINRTVIYLEIVSGKYVTWYRNNNLQPPTDKKPNSKIDEEKDVIGDSINFINDEIRKLPSGYTKGDLIKICANAYDQFVPNKKNKKSISITKFSKSIYSELKHDIKNWQESAFQSYLRIHVSPKLSKGSLNILSIIFL